MTLALFIGLGTFLVAYFVGGLLGLSHGRAEATTRRTARYRRGDYGLRWAWAPNTEFERPTFANVNMVYVAKCAPSQPMPQDALTPGLVFYVIELPGDGAWLVLARDTTGRGNVDKALRAVTVSWVQVRFETWPWEVVP